MNKQETEKGSEDMRYYETLKVLDPQELQFFQVKDYPIVPLEAREEKKSDVSSGKERTILVDNRFSYLRQRMALRKKKRHRIHTFTHLVRSALHI
jgi:hypothetical protein